MLFAGHRICEGAVVGILDGIIVGLGEGLTVGRRVGKGVTTTSQRRANPTPPLELKPGRQVHVVEPALETLLGGQREHWPDDTRVPSDET
jgi:hypothetical protein